jgi:hypothetical protein
MLPSCYKVSNDPCLLQFLKVGVAEYIVAKVAHKGSLQAEAGYSYCSVGCRSAPAADE